MDRNLNIRINQACDELDKHISGRANSKNPQGQNELDSFQKWKEEDMGGWGNTEPWLAKVQDVVKYDFLGPVGHRRSLDFILYVI